jgi:hypothetical protein
MLAHGLPHYHVVRLKVFIIIAKVRVFLINQLKLISSILLVQFQE